MPDFEIKGKGRDTGRRRKRVYSAPDEATAKRLAEDDGTLIEAIVEIPPEPATDRQLTYAKDLGISIPPDVSKADLSDLISLTVDRDKPAAERHKRFARIYGVEPSRYIGKKALFDQIQSTLIAQGREQELISWFAFRVYRELAGAADNAPITKPDDPTILGLASELVTNETVLKSIRRYEGRDLIWFGEYTSPDGTLHIGGSNRTAAYKTVSSLLREQAAFPAKAQTRVRVPISQQSNRNRTKNENQGCLGVVALAIALPTGFALPIVWITELIA